MVNINGHGYSRPPHPRQSWQPERIGLLPTPGDGRYVAPESVRAVPPATVGRALREFCNINHKNFFLAVTLENGEYAFFAGPENVDEVDASRMFHMNIFLQYQQGIPVQALRESGPHQGDYAGDHVYYQHAAGIYGRQDRGYDHDEYDNVPAPRHRKRQRRVRPARSMENDDPVAAATGSRKTTIMVGDADAVWAFYERRFRFCHQIMCRIIAKAFVKLVEPKKQTNHPYTKGRDAAPRWWPTSFGPDKKPLIHKEPDHIKREERIHLLTHILRLLTEPNHRQHEDIRRHNLTVAKLEEAAMDAAAAFFNASEENMKKKKWLKEAFKVAKMEEKYKRGEIDATTQIFVAADNHEPDDDEDDDSEYQRAERKMIKHEMIKHENDSSDSPDPVSRTMSAQSFGSDLKMRDAYADSTMVPAELTPAQRSYVEGMRMAVGGPAAHLGPMQEVDTGRRAMYAPASDFGGATGQSALYTAQWQHGTAAQTTAPQMYAYAQAAHPSHVYQPTQEQSSSLQAQPYMASGYDGLPGAHTLYRNSVGQQSPGAAPQGYSGYLSPTGRFPPVSELRDPREGQ
ncbi:hypothetical protein QBC40DRAFT_250125 [Triangularia verruculosa]|uniref:Subtelomeric hrmA-associated cluster protein AFUB-079030/YDR124W-like helical bundle domain-containing protein n=1 Tax=Triangularia verruculosa TaxID=2587418 RepID=A0AAN6XP89_9PEZI|nr:hypothetical protein QBC40DRAFT_250125 [Triangularia verruculosa]